MGVNRTPGQTASGFRVYVDKSKDEKHDSATLEEIKIGVRFFYKGVQYTVTKFGDASVMLEGRDGIKIRSMLVSLHDLTKSDSQYKLVRI